MAELSKSRFFQPLRIIQLLQFTKIKFHFMHGEYILISIIAFKNCLT